MLNDNGKYRKIKKQNEQLMNETLKDLWKYDKNKTKF